MCYVFYAFFLNNFHFTIQYISSWKLSTATNQFEWHTRHGAAFSLRNAAINHFWGFD